MSAVYGANSRPPPERSEHDNQTVFSTQDWDMLSKIGEGVLDSYDLPSLIEDLHDSRLDVAYSLFLSQTSSLTSLQLKEWAGCHDWLEDFLQRAAQIQSTEDSSVLSTALPRLESVDLVAAAGRRAHWIDLGV